MSDNINHIAPESIELEIVEYCLNELQLTFGDFWYSWFPSNNVNNTTVHINSNEERTKDIIQQTFTKLSFVDSIINIKVMSMPDYVDFKFQHFIHFRKHN